jgi:hypothetical protein
VLMKGNQSMKKRLSPKKKVSPTEQISKKVKPIFHENISPFGHLEEKGHEISQAKKVFPGVRGTLKKPLDLADGVTLKTKTPILIQPLNLDQPNETQKFLITPYLENSEGARDDQPESHRGVNIQKSYEVNLAKPLEILRFNNEHFQRNTEVLFPSADSPSLTEITQSRIPNCFLLAAVQSILNHPDGKAFIRGMMSQNDDGTTTVRLFNPETLEPEYIRVENSVIVDKFGSLNEHNALWMHILDKAYAARKNSETMEASITTMYVDGGQIKTAFSVLTGLKARGVIFIPFLSTFQEYLGEYTFSRIKFYFEKAKETNKPEADLKSNIFTLLDTENKTSMIYDFLGITEINDETKKEMQDKFFIFLQHYIKDPILFDKIIKTKSTDSLIGINPEVAEILSGYFKRSTMLTGDYGPLQIRTYNHIKYNIENDKLICVGAHADDHPAFEKKVTGISAGHAYTVLGTLEKTTQIKNKDGSTTNIQARFIKLRNPWGDRQNDPKYSHLPVGRLYKQNKNDLSIEVTSTPSATFLVELNDFCQYFSHYNMTNAVTDIFQYDREKEQCIANVRKFIENFSLKSNQNSFNLMEIYSEYEENFNALMNIELLELKTLDNKLIKTVSEIFNQKKQQNEEQELITALVDPHLFPRISGDETAVKEHVYSLLKLNWLKEQNQEKNVTLEYQLTENILKNPTQIETWEKLSVIKTILEIATINQANTLHNTLSYVNNLANKFKNDIEIFTTENPETKHLRSEQLILNFMNLSERYHQILNMNPIIKKVIHIDLLGETELLNIASIIESYSNDIFMMTQSNEKFKQINTLGQEIIKEATNLEKTYELSADDADKIRQATTMLCHEKLKPLAKQLNCLDQSEQKRNLGKKISTFDKCINKIKMLLSKAKHLAENRLSNVHVFFRSKNSYEISANRKKSSENKDYHTIKKSFQ